MVSNNTKKFPTEHVHYLMIDYCENIETINKAINSISFTILHFVTTHQDLTGLKTRSLINCTCLRVKKLTPKILRCFDIRCFRVIEAQEITTETIPLLDDLFYCRVESPQIKLLENYFGINACDDEIESLKLLKQKIKNDDVIKLIFEKIYKDTYEKIIEEISNLADRLEPLKYC